MLKSFNLQFITYSQHSDWIGSSCLLFTWGLSVPGVRPQRGLESLDGLGFSRWVPARGRLSQLGWLRWRRGIPYPPRTISTWLPIWPLASARVSIWGCYKCQMTWNLIQHLFYLNSIHQHCIDYKTNSMAPQIKGRCISTGININIEKHVLWGGHL